MPRFRLEELEAHDEVDPFVIELTDGTEVTFPDPRSIHFTALLELAQGGRPDEQLRTLLGEDGFLALAGDPKANGYFLENVLQKYLAHSGLGSSGKRAASSRSSNGTARR